MTGICRAVHQHHLHAEALEVRLAVLTEGDELAVEHSLDGNAQAPRVGSFPLFASMGSGSAL